MQINSLDDVHTALEAIDKQLGKMIKNASQHIQESGRKEENMTDEEFAAHAYSLRDTEQFIEARGYVQNELETLNRD